MFLLRAYYNLSSLHVNIHKLNTILFYIEYGVTGQITHYLLYYRLRLFLFFFFQCKYYSLYHLLHLIQAINNDLLFRTRKNLHKYNIIFVIYFIMKLYYYFYYISRFSYQSLLLIFLNFKLR